VNQCCSYSSTPSRDSGSLGPPANSSRYCEPMLLLVLHPAGIHGHWDHLQTAQGTVNQCCSYCTTPSRDSGVIGDPCKQLKVQLTNAAPIVLHPAEIQGSSGPPANSSRYSEPMLLALHPGGIQGHWGRL
jgi:hypothetical protein